jgi:ABC-2 type transport system permease protein
MRWVRVRAVLRKELLELMGNRGLLASLCALPAIMTVVPWGIALSYGYVSDDLALREIARYYHVLHKGILPQASLVQATARQWLGLYLVTPMFLPVLISSQAVAGEKEKRTIEPLLASPASAAEILLGKSLAAVIPATLITWVFFALFAAGMDLIGWPLLHRLIVPDATWLFAMVVLAPLLALLGNAISVAISARLSDPRLTQQLAALCVMPAVGLAVTELVRFSELGVSFYAEVSVGVAVLDLCVLAIAARLFDRERILTRWS